MKKMLIIYFILIFVQVASASTIIYGVVKDSLSNEILPIANIYIKDTYIGTISNENGHYQLQIPAIPSEVIITYIGYESKQIIVKKTGKQQLDIALSPVAIELNELVVKADAEDPAMAIMRKVIEKKSMWMKKLKSYQAKAYTRTVVENESLIVSLSETMSNIYWDKAKGVREEFNAKKSAKSLSYLTSKNAGSKNILNFYDDNISIIAYKFIGPTHPDALKHYQFELLGENVWNDKTVFQIKVEPKSILQPLFVGEIDVIDEDFAIIDLDLKISPHVKHNPMLKSFIGHYKQKYSDFGKDFWLPIDSRSHEIFEVDMGLIAFPEVIFNKISRISDYKINVNVSKKITQIDFLTESGKRVDRSIVFSDSSTAGNDFNNFKVPLTNRERELYNNPDTTLTLVKAFEPSGLMAKYVISKSDEIEDALKEDGGEYLLVKPSKKFGFQVWYNRVEGLNAGAKLTYWFQNRYTISTMLGYQTYQKKMYYDLMLKYFLKADDENRYFFTNYYSKTDIRYSSNVYSQTLTSVLPLFRKQDYFDYYVNKKFSMGLHYEIEKLGSILQFQFNDAEHKSLNKISNFNLLNKSYFQRINPTINEGQLRSLQFSYTWDSFYKTPDFVKAVDPFYDKNLEIQLEYSSPQFLNSDFDFFQYQTSFTYLLKTFFKRHPESNYLRIRAEISGYNGALPLQRHVMIDASIFYYAPFGVFKTLRNQPIEGAKKVAIFSEYNFKSVPYEILRMNYFVRNKYEFLIHGAFGRVWLAKKYFGKVYNYNDHFHKELGLSIIGKYKFLGIRFDVTQNLDNNNIYFGFTGRLLGLSF